MPNRFNSAGGFGGFSGFAGFFKRTNNPAPTVPSGSRGDWERRNVNQLSRQLEDTVENYSRDLDPGINASNTRYDDRPPAVISNFQEVSQRASRGERSFDPLPNEGVYSEPTPLPNVDRQPSPTPAPDFFENERGVFRNDPSVTIYPEGPDYAGFRGDEFYSGDFDTGSVRNQPHEAMDYSDPVPNRPHSAMDFADTAPAYDSDEYWEQYQMGNQQVQVEIPRHAPSERYDLGAIDENAPSLFGNVGANPFDQWWRTDPVFGDTDVSASASANTGGSMWAGNDMLGTFNNDLALGNDLSADLGSLGYGEDYPATETPVGESPFSAVAEGTGIPVEPDTLPQDIGDTEWTSTPDDRRFLPEPDATPPPTPTRSLAGGPNLRTFGGPISLGAFLNRPLSSLRYGEDYPITYGGRPHDLQPGEGYIDPQSQTGGHWVDEPGGQRWVEGPQGGNGTGGSQPGTTRPGGNISAPQTPSGMTIVGYDEQNGQPVYRDSNGKLFVNPGTGTPVAETYYNYGTGQREKLRETGSFSDSLNQGAEQQAMSPVKFGMNVGGDEGRSVNIPSQSGFMEILGEDGVVAERRPFNPRVDSATRGMLRNWARANTNALDVASRGRARSAGAFQGGGG